MQKNNPRKHKNRVLSLPKPKTLSRLVGIRNFSCDNKLKKILENPEKPRKISKKISSQELCIHADLKKSQSFEENPGKMPETGLFLNKLPMNLQTAANNKILVNQLKRDFEKNTVNDEKFDFERLSYFYRFRMASLLKTMGFHNYYTKDRKNSVKNYKCKKEKRHLSKSVLIKSLKTLVVTKSKYLFKEKIDFHRAGILSSINYDLNSRLQKLQVSDKIDDDDSSSDENKIPAKNDKEKVVLKTNDLKFEFQLWKKKNGIPPNDKVFIVHGEYHDIRESLLHRGWIENKDMNSFYFDLKWCTKSGDIEFVNLRPFQMVNHFEKNASVTTKGGLCRNLRNLIGFHLIDIDVFYPRCYELNDSKGFDDFIEDFKLTKIESILKEYCEKIIVTKLKLIDFVKIRIGIDILQRRHQDVFKLIDEILEMNKFPIVSDKEWEIMQIGSEKENIDFNCFICSIPQLRDFLETFSEEKDFLLMKDELFNQMEICKKNNPQFYLNGPKSVWILKPAGLSRGRGIRCYDNIENLLDAIVAKDLRWVAQKYIENPLIVKSRKFDIRQWVLVTDWNPLKIWFYAECYLRFCAEDYDPNNLKNKFMHLSNNSIAKHSGKFKESDIKGNMWTMYEFAEYLQKISGKNVFFEEIQKKMKKIVIWSLKSAEDMIQTRKNSIEMFGYDFMIDENFNPWLIEINCSPAMDYSTHITQRLVKMVSDDLIKVLVDIKEKDKNFQDTGLFSCIYENDTTFI